MFLKRRVSGSKVDLLTCDYRRERDGESLRGEVGFVSCRAFLELVDEELRYCIGRRSVMQYGRMYRI